MRSMLRGGALGAVLALSACAGGGGGTKSTAAVDDLSDIPRVAPPGALKDPTNDGLNAVLWTQTSAEYRALAMQAFNQAARTLAIAKADPTFNALPEAELGKIAVDAPLAIITDIDETVLDNSAFSVDLIQNPIDLALPPDEARKVFEQRWNDWVAQREAFPIPGAVELLTAADKAGITVFYITNRKDPEKTETCNNLVQAKLPLKDCATQVITRNDAEGRTKDKGSRRKAVAATHRVVLVMGDNLGDFADGVYAPRDARERIVDTHASWWGERWIVLPNPMYGSWEDALEAAATDAVSPTLGVQLQRRRLERARSLRGIDWWAGPDLIEQK